MIYINNLYINGRKICWSIELFKMGLVHWEDPEGWGREGGGRGDWDGEYM